MRWFQRAAALLSGIAGTTFMCDVEEENTISSGLEQLCSVCTMFPRVCGFHVGSSWVPPTSRACAREVNWRVCTVLGRVRLGGSAREEHPVQGGSCLWVRASGG